jgi:hypothetical protein
MSLLSREPESDSHDVHLSAIEDAGPSRRHLVSGPWGNTRISKRLAGDAVCKLSFTPLLHLHMTEICTAGCIFEAMAYSTRDLLEGYASYSILGWLMLMI